MYILNSFELPDSINFYVIYPKLLLIKKTVTYRTYSSHFETAFCLYQTLDIFTIVSLFKTVSYGLVSPHDFALRI